MTTPLSLTEFLDGLQGLVIEGVTVLERAPTTAPAQELLPVAWLDLPTIIGRAPTTLVNSAIRPRQYRALLLLALAYARQNEQEDHRAALLGLGQAVAAALDGVSIGFRLSYEVAIDKKVTAGGQAFYGIAAVITGER